MQVETPQVHWQGDSEIIMSIDFLPNNNFFVTCGPDQAEQQYVRFWKWEENKRESAADIFKLRTKSPAKKEEEVMLGINWKPKFLYSEQGHSAVPNIVRFSPKGTYLASGACDTRVLIWDYKERYLGMGSTEKINKWGHYKSLRGHCGDITDLCWSADEKFIVTGSIDNSALLFNVEKATMLLRFE